MRAGIQKRVENQFGMNPKYYRITSASSTAVRKSEAKIARAQPGFPLS